MYNKLSSFHGQQSFLCSRDEVQGVDKSGVTGQEDAFVDVGTTRTFVDVGMSMTVRKKKGSRFVCHDCHLMCQISNYCNRRGLKQYYYSSLKLVGSLGCTRIFLYKPVHPT